VRGGSHGAEEGFTCAAGEARGEYHQVHTVKLLLHDPVEEDLRRLIE
jgi:hypothetical protein